MQNSNNKKQKQQQQQKKQAKNVLKMTKKKGFNVHRLTKRLTLFRMGFSGAVHGWGVAKKAPSLKCVTHICVTYNDETWHSYTLSKEGPKKYINPVTYLLSSADISIFSPCFSKFNSIKKYRYRLRFDT